MNQAALTQLVRATSRALKAVGYYEGEHPVLRQLHREVYRAFRQAVENEPAVTLACAGSKLLIAVDAKPLTDEPAKNLATHLFSRCVVAIKLSSAATLQNLAALMQCLAESPERIRGAGGLKKLLEERQAQGIGVVEVDFDQLFAGKKTDLASNDPLVEQALGELLSFKQNKDRAGTALGITLDAISSPESLGALLDELLDRAMPGVAQPGRAQGEQASQPPGRSGAAAGPGKGGGATKAAGATAAGKRAPGSSAALGQPSAEELAELASQAFLGTCDKLRAQNAPPAKLAQTAKVLATALVRLSPEARFALLRQLAGAGESAGAASLHRESFTRLSSELNDELILEAIASALTAQGGDAETIDAIGALVRQLRPIESERRRILDSLDQQLRNRSQPLDGLLWQQLQASAFETKGLGMLELAVRQNIRPLAERAQARRKQANNSPEVQKALDALDPRHRAARTAKVLAELLPDQRELSPSFASIVREALEGGASAEGVLGSEQLNVVTLMLKRAEGQPPTSSAAQLVREFLSGPKGAQRTLALARSGACKGSPLLLDALLNALDGAATLEVRRELVAAFSSLDEGAAKSLRLKASEAKPNGVHQIVLLTIRTSPSAAADVARQGLKNRSIKAKEATLRALSSLANSNTISLIAKAAGAEGDEESLRAFALEPIAAAQGDETLRSLQRVAIEVLGQTRSELAVPVLDQLLQRRKLVGGGAFDALRPAVAQALATNGTPAARRVLQEGKQSRHKAIRDACARCG